MKWTRLDRLNEVVKAYDSDLSVIQEPGGMLQVHRTLSRVKGSQYGLKPANLDEYHPQFLFALTDTWTLFGQPVDWGIEPLMETLRSLDQWNAETFEDMVKRRERNKADQERIRDNEFRARAADMRKDFARATNDINTSTLEKVDRRRTSKWH